MIEAMNLVIRRGGRLVIDQVSLSAFHGSTVGIVGPNGAGKSSLLMALHRALSTEEGVVLVDEDDISKLSRKQLARRLAVVSQEQGAVLPLSVRDTVTLGRLPHRSLTSYGDASDRRVVDDALGRAGALDLADRLVTELSGGERQRVLIARAIAQQASHLLLDEPTNHLDIHHQFLLLNLVRELPTTTIVVLHDLNLAAQVCDDLVLLDHGCLVRSGPAQHVLDPDLISRVYRVKVQRIDLDDHCHLLFQPHQQQPAPEG